MRADLNDLVYFAGMVSHGSFAAAARALREPKSNLSRRIAGLEERLGRRLIEQSSRRFRVYRVPNAPADRMQAAPNPLGRKRDEHEYLYRRFSTTGGVQRFKAEHHGSSHDRAPMIAYVQERDIPS